MSTPAQVPVRTAKEARQWLSEQGLSITEFARQHALDRMDVADVLRGKRVGNHGKAHDAAVLLGMKHGRVRKNRKGASK